jgi:hypothetical protein
MRDDLSQGMVPFSTRVMNLSHLLSESARRLGTAPGLSGAMRNGVGQR